VKARHARSSEGAAVKERVARLATEIRQILGEIVTRQEIKDPRVQAAGLITITHVRLTGDLRQATALFTVHGADAAALARVREGLNSAGGYLRHRLGKELSVRAIPSVSFEVDQVFELEERVDAALKDIAAEGSGGGAEGGQADEDENEDDEDENEDENEDEDGSGGGGGGGGGGMTREG
jgi:ribosome-binding factor A